MSNLLVRRVTPEPPNPFFKVLNNCNRHLIPFCTTRLGHSHCICTFGCTQTLPSLQSHPNVCNCNQKTGIYSENQLNIKINTNKTENNTNQTYGITGLEG